MTERPDQQVQRVSAYYRAIDDDDYDRLEEILAPDVVQERPDMTLSGRDRFVAFMRDERPVTETRHPIDATYRQDDGDAVAAQGSLVGPDGSVLTGFVDVFTFEGNSIRRIETYVTDCAGG